jgi:hypothetical protein
MPGGRDRRYAPRQFDTIRSGMGVSLRFVEFLFIRIGRLRGDANGHQQGTTAGVRFFGAGGSQTK